ncbi:MAG: uncharacterized protein QOF36_25 [Microbacteriaceae bacterium]|nr:uncharacterized protein [Microbacteriaceae bacterium]
MSSRPIPEPTPLSEGFWAAAREHQLVLQRCDDCGLYRHYPQERCPDCTGAAWTWTPASGRGVVYIYTASHMPFHPAWADRTPYIVATVELAEGVRMVSDLPPEDVDRVRIGSSVEVFFEDLPGTDVTLPRFRLA